MRAVRSSGRTTRITLGALACCSAIACGARSSLLVDGASTSSSTSASSSSSSSGGGGNGAGGSDPGGGGDAPGGGLPRCISQENPANWAIERYRDQGDYERAVGAVSGGPWVALKIKGGSLIIEKLDATDQGIVVQDRVDGGLPLYPVALDVNDQYFAILVNDDVNFNGTTTLLRYDRAIGSFAERVIAQPGVEQPTESAIALDGDNLVLAHSPNDGSGGIEVFAGPDLHATTHPFAPSNYVAVHATDGVDIYASPSQTQFHVSGGRIDEISGDPSWQVIGGLDQATVAFGTHEAKFRIVDNKTWLAPWPHSQISPPTVVRFDGDRIAVAQETELTGVVGHVYDDTFQWMPILPGDDAPGTGVVILPKIDRNRLGVFYLGLEIPSPEQPLRYFGRVCPN